MDRLSVVGTKPLNLLRAKAVVSRMSYEACFLPLSRRFFQLIRVIQDVGCG